MIPTDFRRLFYTEARRFGTKAIMGIEYGECVLGGRCRYRDFAYMMRGRPPKVLFHYRILDLPKRNIVGLIRHELGHVVDPTPWKAGAEQRADDLVEMVTGKKIRYDKRNVETIGRGRYPRPLYLHR